LLLKQGAKLAENSQDILEELGGGISERGALPVANDGGHEENPILTALGFDPLDFDALCQRSGLTPDSASAMLLTLELEGVVSRLPGGRFQRVR
jgi:DNA processing protein